MTPRHRAIAAFNFVEPDDIIPTFELEFQLTEELLGKGRRFLKGEDLEGVSSAEREKLLYKNAELFLEVAERLDYSIIRVVWLPTIEDQLKTIRILKKEGGHKYLIAAEASGTYGIPSGSDMCEYTYYFYDRPQEAHERAKKMAEGAIEHGKKLIEAGVEVITMCTDYCFNAGPFLSPVMFAQFVIPYLAQIVESHQREGAYVIVHTDGNIMPILDQLVSTGINGLHSLDPMAGVDMGEVKRLVGDKVALCGNVNCSILQAGTVEEVVKDAKRSILQGAKGGGYFYCTSNVPFIGVPLENYLAMLRVREKYGKYPMVKDEGRGLKAKR